MENAEDALLAIYTRLVADRQAEHPTAELKSFPLTARVFKESPGLDRKFAYAVAGIANRGAPFGYIVCGGDAKVIDTAIDPADLDNMLARVVHPRVTFILERRQIGGRTVDFVVIPKSELRPHLVHLDDDRFAIPIRGLGNNSTAARNELDQIYEERTVDVLRKAFPQFVIGEHDRVGAYLDEIGYGFARTDKPQFSLVIAPSTIPEPTIGHEQLFGNDNIVKVIHRELIVETMNTNYAQLQHWFSLSDNLFTGYDQGEDYLEVNQTTPVDSTFRCAARIYDTGTVTYSHPLPTQWFPGDRRAYSPYALRPYLVATLTFASMVQQYFALTAPKVLVRLALKGVQDIFIGRREGFGEPHARLAPMRDPSPVVAIPRREALALPWGDFAKSTESTVKELVRMLDTLYLSTGSDQEL